MDTKLEKALDSLHQRLKARKSTSQQLGKSTGQQTDTSTGSQELILNEQIEEIYKANQPKPSTRDQQDLMSMPFFSLSKNKRVEPIIYEQGDVKVTVRGLHDIGIATIWDADLLIWIASQLNAALEVGEAPSRRLWFVPYQFLKATSKITARTIGKHTYERFKSCLERLQGTTVKTTIKAGGRQITRAWSWLESWEVHEDEKGRMTGVEVILSEWFFTRVVADRAVLAIHTDYFLLTGGIERWLYRIARKHCGNNVSGWSFTLCKLYEKYPPGRAFRFFKRDLKAVVKSDCLPEYHTSWETTNGVDWVHFYLRQGAIGERKLPRSLRKPA